jgi:hypothetical protein
LLPGDGTLVTNRDILISPKQGGVLRINELNGSYDPLHYVLMFPFSQLGYSLYIPLNKTTNNNSVSTKEKFVTAKQFYSYQIMVRKKEGQWIHTFGRLFQQYVTDMYAKIENQRLLYIRLNQKQLRSDLYKGLQDAISLGLYNFLCFDQLLKTKDYFIFFSRRFYWKRCRENVYFTIFIYKFTKTYAYVVSRCNGNSTKNGQT